MPSAGSPLSARGSWSNSKGRRPRRLHKMDETRPDPDALLLNVDDHEAARYAETRILRSAGYTVIEAGTGADALKMVSEQKPVLVLLDVKLPDINGLEVCRIIKSNPATSSTLIIQNSASFVGVADRVKG